MGMKVVASLALLLGMGSYANAGIEGTYIGQVQTGRMDVVLQCNVIVALQNDGSAQVTLQTPRQDQDLIWNNFDISGDRFQSNNDIKGFIKIDTNGDGSLSSVFMQYETEPNAHSPFNLSTISEFCVSLVKQ